MFENIIVCNISNFLTCQLKAVTFINYNAAILIQLNLLNQNRARSILIISFYLNLLSTKTMKNAFTKSVPKYIVNSTYFASHVHIVIGVIYNLADTRSLYNKKTETHMVVCLCGHTTTNDVLMSSLWLNGWTKREPRCPRTCSVIIKHQSITKRDDTD